MIGRANRLPGARLEVTARRVVGRSDVSMTPFEDGNLAIDTLHEFIGASYAQARLHPEEIDTGAVILTGEAARRRNAGAVNELFAAQAGRFVCATAGHHLEARLAAHGSGAVWLSRKRGQHLVSIDIGGGTTKLAHVHNGQVVRTAALEIGARLVRFEPDGRCAAVHPSAEAIFHAEDLRCAVGQRSDRRIRQELGYALASALVQHLCGADQSLWLTEPLIWPAEATAAVLSGGVAEYTFGREHRDFGDLGSELGFSFQQAFESAWPDVPLLPAREGIRATVIGASQFSVSVSGETISLPPQIQIPVHNLAVIRTHVPEPVHADRVAHAISHSIRAADKEVRWHPYALAFTSPPFQGYSVVDPLVNGIIAAVGALPDSGRPCALVFDHNVAQVVGRFLQRRWPAQPFICLDELQLGDLDYLDIGSPPAGQSYVPVVVKSLVF